MLRIIVVADTVLVVPRGTSRSVCVCVCVFVSVCVCVCVFLVSVFVCACLSVGLSVCLTHVPEEHVWYRERERQ